MYYVENVSETVSPKAQTSLILAEYVLFHTHEEIIIILFCA
jgi:hypothetical protein